MLTQPGNKLVETELVCLVKRGHEVVRFLSAGRELRAIDGEKRICGGKSRALVAVEKRVALRQALPQRGGFLDEAVVVTGLRP